MPLIQGFSKQSIAANIKQLIKEGFTREQAIAIAMDIARKAKAKKGRK